VSGPDGGLTYPAAINLVITSTAHPPATHPPDPSACLLAATASLLAAPASLAAGLCSLYSTMEDQGVAEGGLSRRDVWSHFWQPLMCDLHACLAAASCAPGDDATLYQQNGVLMSTVAGGLGSFFSANGMPGWQGLIQRLSETMCEQHAAEGAAPAESSAPSSPADPTQHQDDNAPPSAATLPRHAHKSAGPEHTWIHLMWAGFADAEVERLWQQDVACKRMRVTDCIALLLQVCCLKVVV
jgi:hypothetical protein